MIIRFLSDCNIFSGDLTSVITLCQRMSDSVITAHHVRHDHHKTHIVSFFNILSKIGV